ncbi:ENTH-domain-containing protein [Gloeophyllum trabeum ATCC 11539]|uniref:ENTH-domain-containing protein n=1 Tax=Gloeophyllum trabeum (strain ATCC 11539 / FP-39264 / Madison 617) TaxID=670483 RepID=S7RKD4_GLOTA|nr:ENTH-domain-containing protein [Gloeophyllum trabeum ATCC 11539]EPQ53119.1 ENTH-domain-containing protein [Gloeophyllum trabeum ATCC 11539]
MSTLQHFGKGALRVAKNYTKGYSDTQAKVRDATSNDPWGPSGTQMNEIAQLTYNQNDFVEIMEMLDKRLNDKGKNWRHVFKSLTLLDYLLHAGSENVVIYFRDNLYIIKTLKEFQYVDEYGKDLGANVRQKAKDITNLLQDEGRLREERRSRAHMRDRMVGRAGEEEDENTRRRSRSVPPARRTNKEDEDLRRALEESKRMAEEQAKKSAEDRDLERAIKLSEEEEAKRAKALQDANQAALFDDQNQLIPPTTTNPFPLVDPNAQQSQFMTGLQPQFTQLQPQFTSFNPWQQQAQQEAMQAEYMRQQAEWMRQQQEAAQLQAQQEEWMRQQQLLQMQQQQQQQLQAQQTSMLMAQPTGFGSNNPFAPAQPAQPQPSFLNTSQISSPGPQANTQSPVSFNLGGTYEGRQGATSAPPGPSQSAPPSSFQQQSPQRSQTRADQEHAHLAGLFANRTDDGIDTFGNTGLLRYAFSCRIVAQKTGATSNNPFAMQQQQQQQQQSNEQPFFQI